MISYFLIFYLYGQTATVHKLVPKLIASIFVINRKVDNYIYIILPTSTLAGFKVVQYLKGMKIGTIFTKTP